MLQNEENGPLLDPGATGHGHGHSHGDLTSFNNFQDEHTDVGDSGLRPMVFGFSDGLVTNLCLILGIYMATGNIKHSVIVLTGMAGMLAGGFSMAIGEWISVKIQQEAEKMQLQLEHSHMKRYPQSEEDHFRALLRANSITEGTCDQIVSELSKSSINMRVR